MIQFDPIATQCRPGPGTHNFKLKSYTESSLNHRKTFPTASCLYVLYTLFIPVCMYMSIVQHYAGLTRSYFFSVGYRLDRDVRMYI